MQDWDLAFLSTSFFFYADDDSVVDLSSEIGKRLASLEPTNLSQLSDETYEVICGVAGCVFRKKKLRRMPD